MNVWELQQLPNIAGELDEDTVRKIGMDAVQAYEADKRSRMDWEERMETAIKLALQMKEKKNWPWPDAANVKFPLVTIAALQFSARALPALIKAPDVVKYRVNGADPDGQKAGRAGRIGKHMSYQLLEQDEQWEEDFDKLLIALPILGTCFKKSYYDAVAKKNISSVVFPSDLVVSYYARSLEECERKTEVLELSGREIRERELDGFW
ncbi:MAG: hypothetical protein HKN13_12680 [Rhodothermales bacterium]|nr:hypothetical protein [Rhodothermales bacterium]